MYKSKEIRWFFKDSIKEIEAWFSQQGKQFSPKTGRTDFYLPITDKNDISIKLREGNIEIKQRYGEPVPDALTHNLNGYKEDWVKWSFQAKQDDALAKEIIEEKKYNWIEVYKERIGIKISTEGIQSPPFKDIGEKIDSGYQIEYTRLLINNEQWFTFGLEWFGEKYVEHDKRLIDNMLGSNNLMPGQSYGYNHFLNSIIF